MAEVSRPITVLIILIMMTGVAAEDIQDVRGFVYKQAMGSAKVSYDSIEVVIDLTNSKEGRIHHLYFQKQDFSAGNFLYALDNEKIERRKRETY